MPDNLALQRPLHVWVKDGQRLLASFLGTAAPGARLDAEDEREDVAPSPTTPDRT